VLIDRINNIGFFYEFMKNMVQNKIFNKHFGSSACATHAGALFKSVWYCGSCCGCGLKKIVL
jgi:hypothetical protein